MIQWYNIQYKVIKNYAIKQIVLTTERSETWQDLPRLGKGDVFGRMSALSLRQGESMQRVFMGWGWRFSAHVMGFCHACRLPHPA